MSDDEWVYTEEERITPEQMASLMQLLSLPYVGEPEWDWHAEDDE